LLVDGRWWRLRIREYQIQQPWRILVAFVFAPCAAVVRIQSALVAKDVFVLERLRNGFLSLFGTSAIAAIDVDEALVGQHQSVECYSSDETRKVANHSEPQKEECYRQVKPDVAKHDVAGRRCHHRRKQQTYVRNEEQVSEERKSQKVVEHVSRLDHELVEFVGTNGRRRVQHPNPTRRTQQLHDHQKARREVVNDQQDPRYSFGPSVGHGVRREASPHFDRGSQKQRMREDAQFHRKDHVGLQILAGFPVQQSLLEHLRHGERLRKRFVVRKLLQGLREGHYASGRLKFLPL